MARLSVGTGILTRIVEDIQHHTDRSDDLVKSTMILGLHSESLFPRLSHL
jgi:hypothetical protein